MTLREREILRDRIADQLVEMESWFKGPYKLSFIARAPHLADGDVLVTSDEVPLILAALQRLGTYPPVGAVATPSDEGKADPSRIAFLEQEVVRLQAERDEAMADMERAKRAHIGALELEQSWQATAREQEHRAEAAEAARDEAQRTLESIANNSCCAPCREAGMVARAALDRLATASSE